MDEKGLEDTNLGLEQEKWRAEFALKKRGIELQELDSRSKARELAVKEREEARSRWSHPLVVAVLAAAVAGMANAIITTMNGSLQRDLEREKASASQRLEEVQSESSRILEVIKTGDPDKSAVNLKFLIDSGLISDRERVDRIANYLASRKSGTGPSLPPQSGFSGNFEFQRTQDFTSELQEMVLGNLRDYSAYLEGLGLKGGEKKIRVRIVSSLGAREVLTSDNVIEIDPRIVSDVDMARMAYTDYVLLSNVDTNEIQRMLASLSNGINYYLTASYAGRAQLASITAKVRNVNTPYLHNLDKQQPLSSVFETTIAGGEMWGGSLWAIRSAVGQPLADRIVVAAWKALRFPLPEEEVFPSFAKEIKAAAKALASPTDFDTIIGILSRRNIEGLR